MFLLLLLLVLVLVLLAAWIPQEGL